MSYTITGVGSYPKPPLEGGDFRLRKTLQAIDRGEASAEDVVAAQDDLVREILREQADAGVELATDGQVRWDDPLTRFAEGLEGMAVSGLVRYFDTNTYFRQPVVKGSVRREAPIVVDEYRFAAAESPVPVKAVITGPLTLAALSEDEHDGDRERLVADLATALNEEARDLAAAGAPAIQFDEPVLASVPGRTPDDLATLAAVADRLVDGVGATTVLATYFGDLRKAGPDLFALPFDVFGLDLVAGPESLELLDDLPDGTGIQAGIVDARNTKLERVDDLVALVRRLERHVDPERLWLSPSCGLEFLTREAAGRKLRLLAETKESLR